jgi:oligoendopeptidase F
MASSWSIIKWAYRRYKRAKLEAFWRGYKEGARMEREINEVEEEFLEEQTKDYAQAFMSMKECYAELARALGFEGNGFWGDPHASHEEIVERAKFLGMAA